MELLFNGPYVRVRCPAPTAQERGRGTALTLPVRTDAGGSHGITITDDQRCGSSRATSPSVTNLPKKGSHFSNLAVAASANLARSSDRKLTHNDNGIATRKAFTQRAMPMWQRVQVQGVLRS
jgi:hypothetical protein